MKKIVLLSLCLLLMLALSACGCEHQWVEASCEAPKTCSLCAETEGAPQGHVWQAATCTTPKTCQVCQKTDGQPLDHDFLEASCEAPMTCSRCNVTAGNALGHQWKEATTEAPKTCDVCKAIDGEAIQTDPRFKTANCQDFFGTWTGELEMDLAEQMGLETNIPVMVTAHYTLTFHNDGTMHMFATFEEEGFLDAMRYVTTEAMYITFEAQNIPREEADAYFLAETGTDIATYVDQQIAKISMEDFAADEDGVYYVADGLLYTEERWKTDMDSEPYTLEGDTLTLEEDDMTLVLTREA